MDVRMEGIRFEYDHVPVLQGVNARFASGQLTGIIGPNGSGKTTLLRLLTGALAPSEGAVWLGDAPLNALSGRALAKTLAVVPQKSQLDFEFTALDVVLMGRQPYLGRFAQESARDLQIAREAMRHTGVLAMEKRPVTMLSGGEWQRVVIARALCQQTPVLLLDEPVSNLDIRHQIETLHLVRSLSHERGVTAICVLHDLNLAAHYCDRLLLVSRGSIAAEGAPGDVLTERCIANVYGIDVRILRDENSAPLVLPVYS